MKEVLQTLMLALLLLTSLSAQLSAQAQEPDSAAKVLAASTTAYRFQVSAYAELYYAYDFNRPSNHNRPAFVYSHNRHNEVQLNLGFIKAAYVSEQVRGTLGLMAGTYANANLSAEPGVLRNVFEANAGIRLSKSQQLWLDAGVLPSHIGFESAIGKDCWTLTRSIMADNSPYYEAGARLSLNTADQRWYLAVLYLNGWQRMQRRDGNNTPALGTQISYKPAERLTINYSTFIGSDVPDSSRQMRYFQNFYLMLEATKRFGLILGVDYGMQQAAKGSSKFDNWYALAAILRYQWNTQLRTAIRGEYYNDPGGVIVTYGSPYPFRCTGYSLNMDYSVSENALLRIEGKMLQGREVLFEGSNGRTKDNLLLAVALALSLR